MKKFWFGIMAFWVLALAVSCAGNSGNELSLVLEGKLIGYGDSIARVEKVLGTKKDEISIYKIYDCGRVFYREGKAAIINVDSGDAGQFKWQSKAGGKQGIITMGDSFSEVKRILEIRDNQVEAKGMLDAFYTKDGNLLRRSDKQNWDYVVTFYFKDGVLESMTVGDKEWLINLR